jgi:hypothetical protein
MTALRRNGYITRYVILSIAGDSATLWQPPTPDLWRWIVVGATLVAGDPVLRYNRTTRALDFLTPPPQQAERVVLLTGDRTGPWSWMIDDKAYGSLTLGRARPRAKACEVCGAPWPWQRTHRRAGKEPHDRAD